MADVFVCSNPKCVAVYAHDPMGHCPECMTPQGVGYSTIRKEINLISSAEAAKIRKMRTKRK